MFASDVPLRHYDPHSIKREQQHRSPFARAMQPFHPSHAIEEKNKGTFLKVQMLTVTFVL
jgi:hypothetical protein